MAKLRLEGEALSSAVSNCGSPVSSWLSDLSVSSEADQSLHSFSQSQSQQGEAMAEPDFNHSLSFGPDELSCYKTCDIQRKESLDREMVLSENGSEKEIPIKEKLNKLPPSMDKTGIQSFGGPCNLSLFKTAISVHPWGVDKPMIIQDHTVLASPSEANLVRDPVKFSSPQLASTDLSFDDPWLKRDVEEGIKEPMSDVKTDRSHQVGQIHMAGETRAGIGDHQSFCNDGGDCIISSSGGEVVFSPDSSKRVVDGCEMVVVVAQGECVTNNYSSDHRTSSLPRGWDHVNRHDGLDNGVEYRNLGVTTSTPCSPRATLDRQGSNGKQGFFSHKRGGIPPLPPIRKSSLDQRNRASGALDSLLHQPIQGLSSVGSSVDDAEVSGSSCGSVARQRGSSIDSSKLFSAKLEQLANRTNSLGRAHSSHSGSSHYDCFSLERGESLRGGGGGGKGDGTMPRTGRSLTRGGSLTSPIGYGNTNSASFCGCPGSSSAPQSPAKAGGQSKISAVSKLLMTSSPKTRSLSTSSTKSLSFSTKSLTQSSSRSSSLPPNGKPQNSVQGPVQPQGPSPGSWATQSLSRNRGGNLAAKLPLRAVNGRISELLQGNTGSRSRSHPQGRGTDPAEERGVGGIGSAGLGGGSVPVEDRTAAVQPLPSPYSKITAPRKPQRCSSGHASDNSSVLSGELPPAMGKTALFYHSGGSSGYESMLRDSSENTGSTSSAQDSLSEHSSATASSRRSSKSSKKSRSNTGLQRHRLIPALTLDSSSSTTSHRSSKLTITSSSSSSSSPGACWVDGPLGPHASPTHRGTAAMTETFEITVYEIDDVERLQRRREKGGNKDAIRVSAKLRLLEHRQQRISEVRARYQCLKKELEQTKQYLMLEPHRWTTEFELQQVYEVDSLEYLEALETVTDKLETRVNFCKAHLMMITCFDVSSRHR